MVRRGYPAHVRRVQLVALVALGAAVIFTAAPSGAQVSAVSGSAFGHSVSISLFGGPPFTSGPAPQVTLPAAGGQAGDSLASMRSAPPGNPPPVVFLETGLQEVSTSGQPGATGSATSTATVTNPNALSDFIVASQIQSTCTSDEGGSTGSTTLTDATFTNDTDVRQLPTNPAPNETIEGVQPDVNDSFRVVFNEQTVTGSSITVNAVHIYLLGPSAVGEIIIAQSTCGVTAGGAPGTTQPDTTTTTMAGGQPPGATTTTVGPAATTTVPGVVPVVPTSVVGVSATPLARTGSTSRSLVILSVFSLFLGGLVLTISRSPVWDGWGAPAWSRSAARTRLPGVIGRIARRRHGRQRRMP
jgi:hypothetical protein